MREIDARNRAQAAIRALSQDVSREKLIHLTSARLTTFREPPAGDP
jgi:hypothetical protein